MTRAGKTPGPVRREAESGNANRAAIRRLKNVRGNARQAPRAISRSETGQTFHNKFNKYPEAHALCCYTTQ